VPVQVNEQHRKAEPEREHNADRRVPLAGALPEDAEQHGRQPAPDQCAEPDVEPGEKRERRSGKR
jgi:hypothetical protein